MTLITINQKPVTTKRQKLGSLEELANELLDNFIPESDIITMITADQTPLAIDEDITLLEHQVEQFESIDFSTQSALQLIIESLDQCDQYIDVIIESIHDVFDCYQTNKISKANQRLIDVIDTIHMFTTLINNITKSIKSDNQITPEEYQPIIELELAMLATLKALVPAQEGRDIIMLCDLIEYELVDNLTQWKKTGIPLLREMITA